MIKILVAFLISTTAWSAEVGDWVRYLDNGGSRYGVDFVREEVEAIDGDIATVRYTTYELHNVMWSIVKQVPVVELSYYVSVFNRCQELGGKLGSYAFSSWPAIACEIELSDEYGPAKHYLSNQVPFGLLYKNRGYMASRVLENFGHASSH